MWTTYFTSATRSVGGSWGCQLFLPCHTSRSQSPARPQKARRNPQTGVGTVPSPTLNFACAGTTISRAVEKPAANTGMCVCRLSFPKTPSLFQHLPPDQSCFRRVLQEHGPLLSWRGAQGRTSKTELPSCCSVLASGLINAIGTGSPNQESRVILTR